MQPQNQNDFNFIMDSNQGGSGPAALQDPKKRIIISVLFVSVVLLLVVIAFAVFSSLTKKDSSSLVEVAAYQTELVRISTLGLKESTDQNVRTKATTLQAFMQSDLTNTTSYLSSTGVKFEKEQSSLKYDSKVDKDLESAALRNNYDKVLLEIFDSTTEAYKASLQKALNSTTIDKEKAVLEAAAKNIIEYEGKGV
jgi:hypothetical protein